MAQVLVQNRVSLALPVIPALVQNEGINVKKMSPNTMMIVNLISPDGRYDRHLPEQLRHDLHQGRAGPAAGRGRRHLPRPARLQPAGLARSRQAGGAEPERRRTWSTAISQQNVQVAAGQIGQQPVPRGQQFQLTINTLGRLTDPEQFADIIVKAGTDVPLTQTSPAGAVHGRHGRAGPGRPPASVSSQGQPLPRAVGIVRLRDVARVELGSQQYDQSCTLDGQPSVALSIYQLPGSNALETANGVYAKMEELKTRFPGRAGLPDRLRHDAVHPRVGQRGLQDAARRGHPGGDRRAGVPAELAGGDHSADRRAGGHRRHVRRHGRAGLSASTTCRCSAWCWRSASWSTTRSWCVENVERWLETGPRRRATAHDKAMDEVTGPVHRRRAGAVRGVRAVLLSRRHHAASSSASSP